MKKNDTGRTPSIKQLREAQRILQLHPMQQKEHPTAVAADCDQLSHINTYGELPGYYLDQPFICRRCGKAEIWKAHDQKWYYEVAKGHIEARAVECHDCRTRKQKGTV